MKKSLAAAFVVSTMGLVTLSAQLPILGRGEQLTLRGEIVEISCYRKKGAAEGTGAAHIACAKDCVKRGGPLGILSDSDGLFRIVGNLTQDNNAKLVPYIGQTVAVTGAQLLISNNYDVRSFEVQKIAAVKKGS